MIGRILVALACASALSTLGPVAPTARGETCNGYTVPGVFLGTQYSDAFSGDSNNNIMQGLGASDTLDGDAGADMICGGDGHDIIEETNERWGPSNGQDDIFGNQGCDHIYGGNLADVLRGNNGHDTFFTAYNGCNSGFNIGGLDGGDENDTMHGHEDNDHMYGGANTDYGDGGVGNHDSCNAATTETCANTEHTT